MWLNSALLLSPWLLACASAAVDLDTNVCHPLRGVIGCTGTMVVPQGSKPKYCNRNGQSVVCGVEILKANVDICTNIRNAMPGGPGNAFINVAKPLCGCVPGGTRMADVQTFKPVYNDGPISREAIDYLNAAKVVDSCIVDGKLLIDNARAKAVKDELTPEDDWVITQGADITVDAYQKLMVAVAPCYSSGGCDAAKLRGWYTNYLNASPGLKDGELVRMLKGWLSLYVTLMHKIADAGTASKALQEGRNKASTDVTTTKASICTGTNCNGPTAQSWLAKVSQTLATVQSADTITSGVTNANTAIGTLVAKTMSVINSAQSVPADSYLTMMFNPNAKRITRISEVIQGLQTDDLLRTVGRELKTDINPIILLTQQLSKVKTAQSQLNEVLAPDWMKRTDLFTTEASKKVRDGFIKIQGSMKTQLSGPLAALATALQSLDDNLNQFPLRKQTLQVVTGAAPYTRWNVNAYQVPCASKATKTYTQSGYSASIEYTKIEACQFGPAWYYLPSHHIPYLKWRFYI